MAELRPGQVAVVTGGAAGIGFALAQAFVRRGLKVAIADVDAASLTGAVRRLSDQGGTVMGLPVDVADRHSVRSLRDGVLASFGAVDVICNNAGIYNVLAPAWKIDTMQWKRLLDINYWGVVHGIQEFVPLFLDQGHGHVVNMASMSGFSAVPGSADYCSVKHAVIALSETLRADLDMAGASAIGVTILCPAAVRTAMGGRVLDMFEKASGDRKGTGSGPDLASVLEPSEVADAALRGIERGRLHVTPSPGSRERFLKRVQPILDGWEGN